LVTFLKVEKEVEKNSKVIVFVMRKTRTGNGLVG